MKKLVLAAALATASTAYAQQPVKIGMPLTLLRHHVGKFGLSYLRDQVYLDPHPKELMLLNHV